MYLGPTVRLLAQFILILMIIVIYTVQFAFIYRAFLVPFIKAYYTLARMAASGGNFILHLKNIVGLL